MAQVKSYQYETVIIADRGHLDDPEFLEALRAFGLAQGQVKCPRCGAEKGCAWANGYKRSEESAKGASNLVLLLEREVISNCG
jgi:transposase-like protein